jgi:hypothetical protein
MLSGVAVFVTISVTMLATTGPHSSIVENICGVQT